MGQKLSVRFLLFYTCLYSENVKRLSYSHIVQIVHITKEKVFGNRVAKWNKICCRKNRNVSLLNANFLMSFCDLKKIYFCTGKLTDVILRTKNVWFYFYNLRYAHGGWRSVIIHGNLTLSKFHRVTQFAFLCNVQDLNSVRITVLGLHFSKGILLKWNGKHVLNHIKNEFLPIIVD